MPEIREEGIPDELLFEYGIEYDINRPLALTTDFMLEQIIDLTEGGIPAYRTDSIMKGVQEEN